MWKLAAIDRGTENTAIDCYATFDTYCEARAFADSHEMEARSNGWTWVIRPVRS
jgi:hypothetical protein